MAIIRDSKFHLWIQQNDKLIEHLRLDYEKATGQSMELDQWVEHFYYQSKANNQALPTKEELKYMVWLADNRTLLNQTLSQFDENRDAKEIQKLHHSLYIKTELGTLPLENFLN